MKKGRFHPLWISSIRIQASQSAIDIQSSQKVAEMKKEIFKDINVTLELFDGVKELIINDLSTCSK